MPMLSALDVIDLNQCYSCMSMMSIVVVNGCSRWIHKDCVEDILRDENGDNKNLSYFFMYLSSLVSNSHDLSIRNGVNLVYTCPDC